MFVLQFSHFLLACHRWGVSCIVAHLASLDLDGLRHLLGILVWEAWWGRWVHWSAYEIVMCCSVQVKLISSGYRRVGRRRFWLLVLGLLIHILIRIFGVNLLIEIIHFVLVTRETLRNCRCSPISLEILVIFLVRQWIFTIRIHGYLISGQHSWGLSFVRRARFHFHLRLVLHILIVLGLHLWFLILWSNDLHLLLIVLITFHIYKIWIIIF